MEYNICAMSIEDAKLISQWQYPKPYDLYSFDGTDEEVHEFMEENYYTIKQDDEIIGYICYGESALVPKGKKLGLYKEKNYVDLGLGMNPILTGKGLGFTFVGACINHVKKVYPNKEIRLTVASFNERAIKVYKRHGFKKMNHFYGPKPKNIKFYIMTKEY